MDNGTCYIQYNSNTLYAFPNLTCNEGDLLPSYSSTVRETYYIYNGRIVLSNRQTVTSNTGGAYRDYVSHIWGNKVEYSLDVNYLVLPATLFVLAFFWIIYKWFIRLRG